MWFEGCVIMCKESILLELYTIAKRMFPDLPDIPDGNIQIYGNTSINSIDVIEYIVAVEEWFCVEIDIFDVEMKDFATLASIAIIIEKKLGDSNTEN